MVSAAQSSAERTRSIAFVGLSVALLAVSAWITVPLGPVPFTLQTFVEVFVVLALASRESITTSIAYVGLGALGLPVFSAMRGGIGIIMGPTGGFLLGFIVATIIAVVFLQVCKARRSLVVEYIAGALFIVIVYLCGWLQLMLVTGMSVEAAFAAGVAPFILLDVIKVAVAVPLARVVRKSLGVRTSA